MQNFLASLAVAGAIVAALAAGPPAEAGSCIGVGGTGIGITKGIARWMANKATVDSAKKWANGARLSVTPVKISCSGLSCHGRAKACRR
jgi:hypothetical protein